MSMAKVSNRLTTLEPDENGQEEAAEHAQSEERQKGRENQEYVKTDEEQWRDEEAIELEEVQG